MRTARRLRGAATTFAIAVSACQGSEIEPIDNPRPIVQSVDPERVVGGAAVSVTVLGLGFIEGSEARWNGESRPTTIMDGNRLAVSLSAADLLDGAREIDVVNPPPGGGASEAVALTVVHVPFLSSISPTSATAITTTVLTVQAQGSRFVTGPGGSELLWDGVPLPTSVASEQALSATVPDHLLRVGRTVAVTVRNPFPGGGTSLPQTFSVENPVPEVLSSEPDSIQEEQSYHLEILGRRFVHGATVSLGTMHVPILSLGDTRIVADVTDIHTMTPGTYPLVVRNPTPGGGASPGHDLVVFPKPPMSPTIDYLMPGAAFVGGPAFTLAIVGQHLDDLATVTWNGSPRPFTYVSSSRLEVDITAADIASAGTAEVIVSNPGALQTASAQFGIIEPAVFGDLIVTELWGSIAIRSSLPDGSQATEVTLPSGGARVDASPLELKAVYHDENHIYELDISTAERRRVTTAAEDVTLTRESWPRYSADGAWVYFAGRPSHGREELWRARTDRSGAELVFGEPTGDVEHPAPSHSGDRISYSYEQRIWVRDLTTFTSTDLGVAGVVSRWSPADDWIVYQTPGDYDLRAIRPDGSGDFPLVTSEDVGPGFDMSPDGSFIIATTQMGRGMRIGFPSGTIQYLDALGQIGSAAWFGP